MAAPAPEARRRQPLPLSAGRAAPGAASRGAAPRHRNRGGIDLLFRSPVEVLRQARIDQYGIRCALSVDGAPIKLEIVFEGRVALADPGPGDKIAGVWALALEDKVATKLMANSDRWADGAMMSRDLIDLAMLTPTGRLPRAGVDKAIRAYGESVVADLGKAREQLLGRDGRLKTCIAKMGVTLAEPELRKRIERLHVDEPRGPKTKGTMLKTKGS